MALDFNWLRSKSHRARAREWSLPGGVYRLADQVLRIRARPRTEFLYPSARNFGDIEIALLVHARAMDVEKTSGPIAESASRVQKMAIGVILHDLRRRILKSPYLPVGPDVQPVHR
jgi:hypothetical protein